MDTSVWIILAIAVALVVLIALVTAARAKRRKGLQSNFGPEYDHALTEADSRRRAEAELRDRVKRHDEFDLRPLDRDERNRYLREWDGVQAHFVDEPTGAIREADDLIQRVMRDRGYPVDDFDQRAADLSVEHADVVESYRSAHLIAKRSATGEATTEELRRAVVQYRTLFEDLVGVGDRPAT